MDKNDKSFNNDSSDEKIGNIWGWKFSYWSAGVIFVTLICFLIFGDGPNQTKFEPFINPVERANDPARKAEQKKLDSLRLLEKNMRNDSKEN